MVVGNATNGHPVIVACAASVAWPVMPSSPRAVRPVVQELVALSDLEFLEHLLARVADPVVKAAAVADRREFPPCLDFWATRQQLARLDDVVLNGHRFLQRLSAGCTAPH